ncbi:MAG: hypothetical protein P4L82_16060 [Ancalomicrobiaceae bacterium]|nr:hypothetical protein [Ancalomicrobiaceae bacterium]
MDRIRFASVRDVYDSFRTAAADIGVPPTDELPLDFLKRLLAERQPLAAMSFLAYVLPRRECVWWAAQAIRHFEGNDIDPRDDDGLNAAEAWVREPSEARRKAALRLLKDSPTIRSGNFCARAAAWSGGSITLDDQGGPAEPHMTASFARQALLKSLIAKPAKLQRDLMVQAAEAGARFAAGEPLAFKVN